MSRVEALGSDRPEIMGVLSVVCALALLSMACSDSAPSRVAAPEDVSAALEERRPLARARQLVDAFESLDPALAPAIFDIYREARVLVDASDCSLFAGWWATHDPSAAFEAFMNSSIGGGTVGAEAILRVWMLDNPGAALQALNTAEVKENRREDFTRAVVRGWYESGRAGVWDYLRTLDPGFNRQRLVTTVLLRKLRDEGIEETIAFIDAVPDSDRRFKRNLFHRAAGVIARRDLSRAVEWSDSLVDHPSGGSLGRLVGAVWVQKGAPAEAMAWLISRPQGDWGHVAVRETYRMWLKDDRDAALAWIEGTPKDAATEPAFAVYVAALAKTDPQKGVALLSEIKDESRRERATIRLARRWHGVDPQAAMEWITTLPEELIGTIRLGAPVSDGPLMPS